MAFAAGTIWEVNGGGADGNTGNGGGFDPTNASMATDLAATSGTGNSPVVSSASYTFVAGDVGHWLFVKSGTNWTPGWYQIASVAGGEATLSAAIGAAVLSDTGIPYSLNTAAGVATTASPSSGTWSIDYSRSTAAGLTYTDMVIDGTTNTDFTSAAKPTAVNLIGNIIAVSSGTGFTVQRVQVSSIQAGPKARCDKSLGTLSSTGGNGIMGGALASPGQADALNVANNMVFIRNTGGATPTTYVISSSASVAGGRISDTAGGVASTPEAWIGYETTRTLWNEDANWPKLAANANSVTIMTFIAGNLMIRNLSFRNNGSFTGVVGITLVLGLANCDSLSFIGIATGFTESQASSIWTRILFDGVTGTAASLGGFMRHFKCLNCGNGVQVGLSGGGAEYGVIANCSGPNFGLSLTATHSSVANITVYGQTDGDGLLISGTAVAGNTVENVLVYGTSGAGHKNFNVAPTNPAYTSVVRNCAGGNGNTADTFDNLVHSGFITLTADPFINAAGLDFGLNDAAGGGALVRSSGYFHDLIYDGQSANPPYVGFVGYLVSALVAFITGSPMLGGQVIHTKYFPVGY